MEKLENLELVEVERNEKDTNLKLLMLDNESGYIYDVKFNKQKYNKDINKFEDNEEQAKWANEKLVEYLGFDWDNAERAIGKKLDVYVYEGNRPFNSFWESTSLAKPDAELEKKIRSGYKTKILEIKDNGNAYQIIVEINGQKYGIANTFENGNFRYADWINSRNMYFPNGAKIKSAKANFKKQFGIDVDEKDSLVGKEIVVFPAKAGANIYLKFENAE